MLRFNVVRGIEPSINIWFYSDRTDGSDNLADSALPAPFPTAFYSNMVTLAESGPSTIYTPQPGQPGYAIGSDGLPITYHFNSDVEALRSQAVRR